MKYFASLILACGALLAQGPVKPAPEIKKADELHLLKMQKAEAEARAVQAEFRASPEFQRMQQSIEKLQKDYDAARLETCAALKMTQQCRVDTSTGVAIDPAPHPAPASPAKKE